MKQPGHESEVEEESVEDVENSRHHEDDQAEKEKKLPEIRKPGPEMERIYRKHSPSSFHDSYGHESHYGEDDEEYKEREAHRGHGDHQANVNKRLEAQWRSSGNGKWHSKHYKKYEKQVEVAAAKEESEPFYEYLQLIPNPDFFQPHVEYEDHHHRRHHHHDDDADERFQKQRMQEQR